MGDPGPDAGLAAGGAVDRSFGVQRGHQRHQWHVGDADPGFAWRKMENAFHCLDRSLDRLFGAYFLWHLPLALSDIAMAHGKSDGRMVAFGLHTGIERSGGQFVLPLHGKTTAGQARSPMVKMMTLTVEQAIFQATLNV